MSNREVRKERSGLRDKEFAERAALWGIQLPQSAYRDSPTPMSIRHREYGYDCPVVDLDWPVFEYNHGTTVAIIDYKERTPESRDPDRGHPTHQAMGKMDTCGHPVPYLVVFYHKKPWILRCIPMNDEADRLLRFKSCVVSELQFVKWLYRLRNIPLPLSVAKELDTYQPQKKAIIEVEALSNLIDEVEQSSLFTVDEVSA